MLTPMHRGMTSAEYVYFMQYRSDIDLGNCSQCGAFYNLKPARLVASGVQSFNTH